MRVNPLSASDPLIEALREHYKKNDQLPVNPIYDCPLSIVGAQFSLIDSPKETSDANQVKKEGKEEKKERQEPIEIVKKMLMSEVKQESDHLDKVYRDNKDNPLDFYENWRNVRGSIEIHHIFEQKPSPLQPKVQPQSIKRVLVLGPAGIGKTTLSQYLTYQWAIGEQWLKRWNYVFHLPLRKLGEEIYLKDKNLSLAKVLHQECLEAVEREQIKVKEIQSILNQNNYSVLLILDGYDEITHLLGTSKTSNIKKFFEQALTNKYADIILTSRPYQLDKLPIRLHQFDRILENRGFSDEQVIVYTQTYFEPEPEIAEELVQWLKANPRLAGMTHVPINLMLLCGIWKRQQVDQTQRTTKKAETANSEDNMGITDLYQKIFHYLIKSYLDKKEIDTDGKGYGELENYCKTEINFLERLAFKGSISSYRDSLPPNFIDKIKKDYQKLQPPLDYNVALQLGFLNTEESKEQHQDINKSRYFIHSSFQAYFAARFVINRGLASEEKSSDYQTTINFLRREKYNPRYTAVFTFAAGLASANKEHDQIRNVFWNTLLDKPLDLIGIGHFRLLIRCLEEVGCDEQLSYREDLLSVIKQLIDFLVENEEKGKKKYQFLQTKREIITLLSTSPQLLQATQIVEDLWERCEKIKIYEEPVTHEHRQPSILLLLSQLVSAIPASITPERIKWLMTIMSLDHRYSRDLKYAAMKILAVFSQRCPSEVTYEIAMHFITRWYRSSGDYNIAISGDVIVGKALKALSLQPELITSNWIQHFFKVFQDSKDLDTKTGAANAIKIFLETKPQLITLELIRKLIAIFSHTSQAVEAIIEAKNIDLTMSSAISSKEIADLVKPSLLGVDADLRKSILKIVGQTRPDVVYELLFDYIKAVFCDSSSDDEKTIAKDLKTLCRELPSVFDLKKLVIIPLLNAVLAERSSLNESAVLKVLTTVFQMQPQLVDANLAQHIFGQSNKLIKRIATESEKCYISLLSKIPRDTEIKPDSYLLISNNPGWQLIYVNNQKQKIDINIESVSGFVMGMSNITIIHADLKFYKLEDILKTLQNKTLEQLSEVEKLEIKKLIDSFHESTQYNLRERLKKLLIVIEIICKIQPNFITANLIKSLEPALDDSNVQGDVLGTFISLGCLQHDLLTSELIKRLIKMVLHEAYPSLVMPIFSKHSIELGSFISALRPAMSFDLIRKLIAFLNDSNDLLRANAIAILIYINIIEPATVNELIEHFTTILQTDSAKEVRENAAYALTACLRTRSYLITDELLMSLTLALDDVAIPFLIDLADLKSTKMKELTKRFITASLIEYLFPPQKKFDDKNKEITIRSTSDLERFKNLDLSAVNANKLERLIAANCYLAATSWEDIIETCLKQPFSAWPTFIARRALREGIAITIEDEGIIVHDGESKRISWPKTQDSVTLSQINFIKQRLQLAFAEQAKEVGLPNWQDYLYQQKEVPMGVTKEGLKELQEAQFESKGKEITPVSPFSNVHSPEAYLAELESHWPEEFRELLSPGEDRDAITSLRNYIEARHKFFGTNAHGFNEEVQYLILYTAYYGSLKEVTALVEGSYVNPLDGANKFTLLHLAALKGDVKLFKKAQRGFKKGTIKFSMDLAASVGPYDHVLPIHCAIIGGHEELVKRLLKKQTASQIKHKFGPGENEFTELGWLSLAVYAGQDGIVKLLIQNIEDLTRISSVQGMWGGNILHMAVESFRHEILKELLSHDYFRDKKFLEGTDTSGFTPFALAGKLCNTIAMRTLKEKGAEIDQPVTGGKFQDYRPLHLAVESAALEAVQWLLHWKANPNQQCWVTLKKAPKAKLLPSQLAKARAQETQTEADGISEFSLKKIFTEQATTYSTIETIIDDYIRDGALTQFDDTTINKVVYKNMVFKGGGPKGIVYVGALVKLAELWEKSSELRGLQTIERVGGTSAGAITAALFALGYTPKVMHELLLLPENSPKQFLEDMPLGFLSSKPAYQKMIEAVKEIAWYAAHPLQLGSLLLNVCKEESLCTGNVFLNWIEGHIKNATGKDWCTFGELKELIDSQKKRRFRHLYMVTVQVSPTTEIKVLSSEDPRYKNYTIAHAIRASMSIPVVFKPAQLYQLVVDADNKRRVVAVSDAKHIDGGVLGNYPLKLFDKARYVHQGLYDFRDERSREFPVYNEATLGFYIKPETPVEEPVYKKSGKIPMWQAVNALYKSAQDQLHEIEQNGRRSIAIGNAEVTLFDFDLSDKQLADLFAEGEKAVEDSPLPQLKTEEDLSESSSSDKDEEQKKDSAEEKKKVNKELIKQREKLYGNNNPKSDDKENMEFGGVTLQRP